MIISRARFTSIFLATIWLLLLLYLHSHRSSKSHSNRFNKQPEPDLPFLRSLVGFDNIRHNLSSTVIERWTVAELLKHDLMKTGEGLPDCEMDAEHQMRYEGLKGVWSGGGETWSGSRNKEDGEKGRSELKYLIAMNL